MAKRYELSDEAWGGGRRSFYGSPRQGQTPQQ